VGRRQPRWEGIFLAGRGFGDDEGEQALVSGSKRKGRARWAASEGEEEEEEEGRQLGGWGVEGRRVRRRRRGPWPLGFPRRGGCGRNLRDSEDQGSRWSGSGSFHSAGGSMGSKGEEASEEEEVGSSASSGCEGQGCGRRLALLRGG